MRLLAFVEVVVVVVVVGAAYCTDIFPQRTHIYTLLCSETCNSINSYYATISHGTIFFFLSFVFLGRYSSLLG